MKKISLFVAVAVVATLLMVSFTQKTGPIQPQETKGARGVTPTT